MEAVNLDLVLRCDRGHFPDGAVCISYEGLNLMATFQYILVLQY
jgi:hypothetical protein